MLGLKSAIAYLGGCMSLKFRTEIWAGDINLGVIYIRMNLNHETRWDLQGIIKQKEEVHGLSLGAPSVWRSGEEAIKETEAMGHEVRQIKRAWSPWAPVKQVLKKGHVINHAKWLSCEDWTMTTGFSNMEITGDPDKSNVGRAGRGEGSLNGVLQMQDHL